MEVKIVREELVSREFSRNEIKYTLEEPTEDNYKEGIEAGIPAYTLDGMRRYIRDGVTPGAFARAVLCNDLMRAVHHADHDNYANLGPVCQWVHQHLCGYMHGSEEKFERWVRIGGLTGTEEEDDD